MGIERGKCFDLLEIIFRRLFGEKVYLGFPGHIIYSIHEACVYFTFRLLIDNIEAMNINKVFISFHNFNVRLDIRPGAHALASTPVVF